MARTNTIYVDSDRGIYIRDNHSGAVVLLHEAISIGTTVSYDRKVPEYDILMFAESAHIGNADHLIAEALDYQETKKQETAAFKSQLQKGT